MAEDDNKKDLPQTILELIFEANPDGVSVGEIRHILNRTQELAEDI